MIKNSIGVYPTCDDIQVYLRSSTVFVNLQNRKGEYLLLCQYNMLKERVGTLIIITINIA